MLRLPFRLRNKRALLFRLFHGTETGTWKAENPRESACSTRNSTRNGSPVCSVFRLSPSLGEGGRNGPEQNCEWLVLIRNLLFEELAA
jgi:hypothetical protein